MVQALLEPWRQHVVAACVGQQDEKHMPGRVQVMKHEAQNMTAVSLWMSLVLVDMHSVLCMLQQGTCQRVSTAADVHLREASMIESRARQPQREGADEYTTFACRQ